DHPLQLADRRVELTADERQREVDDGHVEPGGQTTEAQHRERDLTLPPRPDHPARVHGTSCPVPGKRTICPCRQPRPSICSPPTSTSTAPVRPTRGCGPTRPSTSTATTATGASPPTRACARPSATLASSRARVGRSRRPVGCRG